jgi:hypothetical protein
LAGCNHPAATESEPGAVAAPKAEAEPGAAACALPAYDLLRLQPRAAQRLDSVQVAGLYNQHARLKRDFNYYSRYEHVYALDTVRCAGFTVLTLYREDESGHRDLYYLTLDAAARRVQQVELVAAWGSDGGWAGETWMQRRGRRLRVTAVDELSEEATGTGYSTSTTDSVVVDYHLSPAGRLMRTRIDSARQIVHTRAQ